MSRIANFTRKVAAVFINVHAAALVRVAHKAEQAEVEAWQDYEDAVYLSRAMNERKRQAKARAEEITKTTDNVVLAVHAELAHLPFLQDQT